MRIMKRKYMIFVLFGVLGVFSACQKENIAAYSDAERINVDLRQMNLTKDTIEVSLGFYEGDVMDIDMKLYVMGYPKDYDREVAIEVVSSNNAEAGKTYELPEKIIMPANDIRCTIPLKVLRDPDLMKAAKSFRINLKSSDDFEVGLYPTLYISVTDDVPTVWIGDENWMKDGSFYLSIEDCFGKCSRVKYKFVYEVLGIYDFSVWNVWGFMYDKAKFVPAKKLLKKELEKWEAVNGPMMDENNERVTFPD